MAVTIMERGSFCQNRAEQSRVEKGFQVKVFVVNGKYACFMIVVIAVTCACRHNSIVIATWLNSKKQRKTILNFNRKKKNFALKINGQTNR